MPLQCRNQIWQSWEEGAGKRCSESGVHRVISRGRRAVGSRYSHGPVDLYSPWLQRPVSEALKQRLSEQGVGGGGGGGGGGWLLFTKVRLPKVACTAHNTIHTPSLTNYARFSLRRGRGGGGGGVEIVVTDRHGGMVGLLMSMPCFISQPAPTLLFCRTLSLSVYALFVSLSFSHSEMRRYFRHEAGEGRG